MYASYLPQNGINNFYAQNGLSQPSASQISNSTNRDQQISNLMGGGVIAAATGGVLVAGLPVATAVGGLGFAAIGATTSGGMDAAGQYAQTGTVRPIQSVFATGTGAIAGPIGAELGLIGNMLLYGASNTANTLFNNAYYGESSSGAYAFAVGALSGAAGYGASFITTRVLAQLVRPIVFQNYNPSIPALLQGAPNAFPLTGGGTLGSLVQGGSSFVPSKDSQK
ncbi:hypothetical protein FSO04_18735 [Paraburkholderia madseniana]|uniref:Uncharacterized protein n=1 Tax=Paraburkholderia madseniana TaxID=2599607 RepID=A0A6N6WEU3_9BURK|nr:hypothetical protein [Paraburkholderia madseniana]KAE8758428.1 hypothetical protein FSO04_18735 [Paraburkholderia madseniana]